MPLKRPTMEQMSEIVKDLGMSMEADRIREFLTAMEGNFQAYDLVDAMPDDMPEVKYPRTAGRKPGAEENTHNAWYVKCEIKGAADGPLAGKTVAVKDNVCVAGLPMMNGSVTLQGYTPDMDATVVTRVLDAGAIVVGKTHCEGFCLSGGSHTNSTGPVHNPHKMGFSSAGSSSGSAVAVALGEADMAIGGDQGGSVRLPSSYCGTYGMKATHGLVPYTGAMPIEATIDHLGPITNSVEDNALLLEVIAGDDGLDPRQYAPRVSRYTEALGKGADGLKIGVLKEGFGFPTSEDDVDQAVRDVGIKLKSLGAQVEEVSVPMHLMGPAIWSPIALEGLQWQMMRGNGMGMNWEGLYITSLLDAHAAWRQRADELSDSLKISMFVGEFFIKHHRGRYYAKAQNLSRKLRAAYDKALSDHDLLLMPTTPMKAPPLPEPDAPLDIYLARAFENIPNTAPFDASGHPAMSFPCGMSDGLPMGAMLVGKHYDESTIYQAVDAFSQG
ncbi:MAG: Asp-tRNA(Asn)/Glu-tRNA(Gln) amidotransferase GatCAB subunit A [Salinisphaeraceae bacterium]|nr:Asp-tRNA(Asn)/Glu-tRNA(Gln) amidotransferase GatCAB subunit A [Salinisphaeraceae bacterium]